MQCRQGRGALTYRRDVLKALLLMKKTSHVPSFLVEVSFGTVLDTFLAIHKKINEKYLPWHWCAEFSVSLWKQAPRMTRDTLLEILQWGWVDIELEMPSGIKVPLS